MHVTLDHTSVPCHDKQSTAEFFVKIFGFSFEEPRRTLLPVRVNDSLALNFEDFPSFDHHHYAFLVNGQDLNAIQDRLKASGVAFGSTTSGADGEIYDRRGERGFYFQDPNGHSIEVLSRA